MCHLSLRPSNEHSLLQLESNSFNYSLTVIVVLFCNNNHNLCFIISLIIFISFIIENHGHTFYFSKCSTYWKNIHIIFGCVPFSYHIVVGMMQSHEQFLVRATDGSRITGCKLIYLVGQFSYKSPSEGSIKRLAYKGTKSLFSFLIPKPALQNIQ